mmetsp:Transcript_52690/g.138561  ORF Transcript_52690/g.138561 Transcript_52690/m.138561 type:complete len:121 (+) Transcript_52690:1153-1515(+)
MSPSYLVSTLEWESCLNCASFSSVSSCLVSCFCNSQVCKKLVNASVWQGETEEPSLVLAAASLSGVAAGSALPTKKLIQFLLQVWTECQLFRRLCAIPSGAVKVKEIVRIQFPGYEGPDY